MSNISMLKEYFKKDDFVLLAFLFGSRAKKIQRKISDWDIGVYFKPYEYLELETERDYPDENKIWPALVDILHTDDVDFVVLNRAAPSLVYNVLRVGIPLIVRDKGLYLDLLCKTSYEAMDWWNFVNEFWEIGEKSQSLSPEGKARLTKHLIFLQKEFEEIKEIKKFNWEDYQKDSFKRKIIERWIENLVVSVLDIAKIILASEKELIPESYKETLRNFGFKYFNEEFANKFSEFAKFRNIVVHEYLDMRWKQIKDFIKEAEILYPLFIQKIKDILK
ncbi:MAG: DUF86 domain-containing protein [bacterium]|nr:DUF86 domain-containing protein [bacterium]